MKKYKLVTLWELDLPARTEYLQDEIIAESYYEGVQRIKEVEDVNLTSAVPWKVVSITITSFESTF